MTISGFLVAVVRRRIAAHKELLRDARTFGMTAGSAARRMSGERPVRAEAAKSTRQLINQWMQPIYIDPNRLRAATETWEDTPGSMPGTGRN